MALKRKEDATTASSTTPKSQIIKVNPYENPDNVMELMAKICSAKPLADTKLFWNPIYEAFDKEIKEKSFGQYLSENRNRLLNKDFRQEFRDYCWDILFSLEKHQNTAHTQIVVAGGFSSGKSSFLNKLTKCKNLLPTGVEPVSVVKTYLYCSSKNKNVEVKGVNQKNVLVTLDTGVLQAIQHSNRSNIYLASILEKLFVEIPSIDLDGLAFIDTPGYNNSDKANDSNGKTDNETAMEALNEGNVLFWMVDCEKGTTVSQDIERIKMFDGPKVIIFNKADKKGAAEARNIVESAHLVLSRSGVDNIIDVLAYSTLDDMIYYSHRLFVSFGQVIAEVKKTGNGFSEQQQYRDAVNGLFDDEMNASRNEIERLEEILKKQIDDKEWWHKTLQEDKESNIGLLDDIKKIMIESYSDVLKGARQFNQNSYDTLNSFLEFINRVNSWNNGRFLSSDDLSYVINSYSNKYDSLCDTYNSINYTYYEADIRNDTLKVISNKFDELNSENKNWYDDASNDCDNTKKLIADEKEMLDSMWRYRNLMIPAIDNGIRQYSQRNIATTFVEEKKSISIFEAIKNDDFKAFQHCFEDGLDISICNSEGYNPMTYATLFGNNAMVDFMLKHDADTTIKDRRGYNAFHTAVENQFRDICTMLLEINPDLISTKTANGESVEQLADKHTFSTWIKNEISNAF